MTAPSPRPGIMDIELYVGGQSALPGRADALKLSSNENPAGASPRAAEAFERASRSLHLYPSQDHRGLREAIGEVHGLDPDRIVCGAGSDELLYHLCKAYAGPGDEVIRTEHGFAIYEIAARAVGATPIRVPERERVTDVDAVLAGVTERTRLVYVANPNNPTGTMIGDDELVRLADGLPGGCMLVVDGAYLEYAGECDGGATLAGERANVFMTRTFSKLYGLGGLRVGWGYGPREVVDVLNRIREPFNLGAPQLAAAEAAMRDREFASACASANARLRERLAGELASAGVPSDPSRANFVLARLGDADEAAACDAWLKEEGIIVRQVANYGLPHCLRITVGDEAACGRVAGAVRGFMERAR